MRSPDQIQSKAGTARLLRADSDKLTNQGTALGHEANRVRVKVKGGVGKKKERRIGEDLATHSVGLKSGKGFATKSAHE